MLFNTKLYIFIFLPFILIGYFYLARVKFIRFSHLYWLAIAGFIFYASWSVKFIGLVVFSIVINYLTGKWIAKSQKIYVLWIGILFNLILLGYFKYTNFILFNINHFMQSSIPQQDIILPLGISFFTFTQIAYLVDRYKGKVSQHNFLNYTLFVNFFPHLLAGPIIHHKEMMSQFVEEANRHINWENMYKGLFLFSIGLCKKVLIADYLGAKVIYFYGLHSVDLWQAWAASLSYTIQLYFDFSGYSDMALGSALLFNIKLPINFNSPYQARSIQEFWQRWHMTLSRFLRDYIYIPLGGNRKGQQATYLNLLTTFVIGGIWHGAGWTFIIWGLLHGIASTLHKFWQSFPIRFNKRAGIFLTFMFINLTWVFFRSGSVHQALNIIKHMFIPHHLSLPSLLELKCIFVSLVLTAMCIKMPNSNEIVERYVKNKLSPYLVSLLATTSLLRLLTVPSTFFLYFQF